MSDDNDGWDLTGGLWSDDSDEQDGESETAHQPDGNDDSSIDIEETVTTAKESAAEWHDRLTADEGEPTILDRFVAVLRRRRVQLGLGAVGTVIAAIAMTAVAWAGWGLLSGVGTIVGLIVGVSGPWIYVRVMRTPAFGSTFATAFYILAQLTYGAGAIVRREDGRYEWRRLREDDAGLYATLESGNRVDIDGEKEELPSLAWAPVAVVEQRTENALNHILVDGQYATERPDPQRGSNATIETPLDEARADGGQTDGWHIDSSKLERWCRGSADSEPVRAGLRKALEEEGGEQQISQLYVMIAAGTLMIFGFGMTSAVMLL